MLVPRPATRKGDQVRDHCRRHPDWTLVCEEDGHVIGFVTFGLDHETRVGTIGNNAVDPDCGVRGVGQQMYRAVFERLRDEGMKYAMVETGLDHAHAPARRAYMRAGFDIHTEHVRYYRKL